MDEEIVLTDQEIKRITEAVLFAAGYPVTFDKLAEVTHTDAARIEKLVKEYAEEYNKTELPRGVQLLILGKACQLVTNEVFSDYVREALGVKSGGKIFAGDNCNNRLQSACYENVHRTGQGR